MITSIIRLLKIVVISIAIISIFSGCISVSLNGAVGSGKSWLQGKGSMVTQTFEVDSYTAVDVRGYYEIIYSSNDTGKVVIELQENLVPHLLVSVKNGVLTVDSDRDFQVTQANLPKLYIYTPTLEGLDISGAATMRQDSDTITSDKFTLTVSGASDANFSLNVGTLNIHSAGAGSLRFSGTADTADISLSGAGDIGALGLQTRVANVVISGAGTVRLSVSESLDATISGVGSLEYAGNPQVSQRISGIGSIRNVG